MIFVVTTNISNPKIKDVMFIVLIKMVGVLSNKKNCLYLGQVFSFCSSYIYGFQEAKTE